MCKKKCIMHRNFLEIFLYIALFGLSVFIFFYSSVNGLGIGPDSLGFLGNGSAFAPLYNFLLRSISNGIHDGAAKAQYLHFVLYVASSIIIYSLIRGYSSSTIAALLAVIAFSFNKYVLDIYLKVHNEALALFLTALCFYFFGKHLQNPVKKNLLSASFVAGLIAPTRYAFAPILGAGVIFFLFHPGLDFKKRIKSSLLYGSISTGLTLIVLILTDRISFNGNVAGREFALNGNADLDRYLQGLLSFGCLFFPTTFGKWTAVFIAICIIVMLIILLRSSYKSARQFESKRRIYLANIALAFGGLYILLLLISVQIEAYLPLSKRYMIPLVLVFSLAAGLSFNWKELQSNLTPVKVRSIVLALAIVILYFPANGLRLAKYVYKTHDNGIWYNSVKWRNSPTVKAFKSLELDENDIIISNGPDVLKYFTSVKTTMVPAKFHLRTGKVYNKPYPKRVEEMKTKLFSNGGYYVHFYGKESRFYLPSLDETIKLYDLYPIVKTIDGAIYMAVVGNS